MDSAVTIQPRQGDTIDVQPELHLDPPDLVPRSPVAEAAFRAWRRGISVVPPTEIGSKAPGPHDLGKETSWGRFQKRKAILAQMEAWYGPRQGWGIVCGNVSGNLEALDFDDGEVYRRYVAAALALGLGDLIDRVEQGCSTRTPSGGVHWLWRCATIGGSQKLAERPAPTEDNPKGRKTLIETKGEGGYVIEAPSGGGVHPSGRPYEQIAGGPETIAKVTAEERDLLLDLARSFDETPKTTPEEPRKPKAERKEGEGKRPGDDFNDKATWDEILGPAGWSKVGGSHGVTYWRRPGKDRGGSATTGFDPRSNGADLLRVFSTSTSLDTDKWYTKFAAYAALNHSGDFKAAATALYEGGYGTYIEDERDPDNPWVTRRVEKQNPRPKGPDVKVGGKSKAKGGHEGNGQPEAGAKSHAGPPPEPPPDGWHLDVRDASDYRIRPLKFLSKPRLPRGVVVTLGGAGGEGKSTLVEHIAADLSRGRPTLGSDVAYPEPVDVLILACEDGREDALLPRLIAAGADISHLKIIEGMKNDRGDHLPFDITHLPYLRRYIEQGNKGGRNFKLVIIDPITTYVGRAKIDDHRDAQLKPALEGLSRIAQELDVTFLCLAHLNKSGSAKSAAYRILGGGAYSTSSRLVFIYAADPEDPDRRILASPKANIPGGKPPSLAVRIGKIPEAEAATLLAPHVEHLSDEDRADLAGQLYRIAYDGISDRTAEDILDAGSSPGSRKEKALDFLREILGGGKGVQSNTVYEEGKKRRISRSAIWEAKDALNINACKVTDHNGTAWYWQWVATPDPDDQPRND